MNKKNLFQLAKGLLSKIPYEIDPDDTEFSMRAFTKGYEDAPFCNTVGCAVGWAPFYGIEKSLNENFRAYSSRQLCNSNFKVWEFMFGGNWYEFDNTKEGAGKRILFVLLHWTPETDDLYKNYVSVELYKFLNVGQTIEELEKQIK